MFKVSVYNKVFVVHPGGDAAPRPWSSPPAGQLHHLRPSGHRDQPIQQPRGVLPRRHHRGDEGREDHPRPSRAGRQDQGEHPEAQGADQPPGCSEDEGEQLRSKKKRRLNGDQCSVMNEIEWKNINNSQ